jgi:hypothetical protein
MAGRVVFFSTASVSGFCPGGFGVWNEDAVGWWCWARCWVSESAGAAVRWCVRVSWLPVPVYSAVGAAACVVVLGGGGGWLVVV